MIRRCPLVLLIATLLLSSCMRAERYKAPPAKPKEVSKEKPIEVIPPSVSWVEPRATADVPIVFVSASHPEWTTLKSYWNEPAQPVAMRLAYVGLTPLHAFAALTATEVHATIKIKVPLGLPDPTPFIPATNPPELTKWRLGKKLFFENMLRAGPDVYACATCHDPKLGFTDRSDKEHGPARNTLSLMNVVYNRRQFWDGRVATLEETIVRSLDDERTQNQTETNALDRHIWGGIVQRLETRAGYVQEFQRAFGVEHPTQDTVARALATFMRTILSGDSVYDRAEQQRVAKKQAELTVEHFKDALADKDVAGRLEDREVKEGKPEELPGRVLRGHAIFQKSCRQCHRGDLFTDHDYHNVGYPQDLRRKRSETGRAAVVPIGLKDTRLLGAYRTPTLRNLPRTNPYFHDSPEVTMSSSLYTLMRVVEFYDQKIQWSPSLAEALKQDDQPLRLELSQSDREALVLFLRSLDGAPVDAKVAAPP